MRAFFLAPLLALGLAACGDSEEEATIEDNADLPEVEAIEGRDITAIDAATDSDAGLADEDVPGRDADGEDAPSDEE